MAERREDEGPAEEPGDAMEEELRRLEEEPFFVGYLPMDKGLSRFAYAAAAAAVLLAVAVALAATLFMRSPGEGIADYRSGQRFTGLLHLEPYPHLRTLGEAGALRTLLLVRGGKFGLPVPAAMEGRAVTVRGGLVERDGRGMLEVQGGVAEAREEERPDEAALARLREVPEEELGRVTLAGEIVDAKCYLGRMRPGGGRGHRACAQLCIAGGIPPALVTRAEDGSEAFYLLAGPEGEGVAERVLPWVAEPVSLEGALRRRGDLLILRVDPSRIRRL